MSRVCQLCLPQLWSDELSPVDSGREGCVEKANCEEGEGVVRQGGRHVPGTVDGVHESWREEVQVQEKQVPSSGTRRANTESCPPTPTHTHTHTHPHPHTHTHTHTHTPWTLLAQRELQLLFWAFLHWILEPWLMASCQLPAS